MVSGAGDEAAEAFGLQGGPEAFHGGIVVAVVRSAHGGGCPAVVQQFSEDLAGILAAMVRMMEQSAVQASAMAGFLPSFGYQRRGQTLREVPANHLAGEQIKDAG